MKYLYKTQNHSFRPSTYCYDFSIFQKMMPAHHKIIFNFHNNLHQTEIDPTNCIIKKLIGFSNIYFLMTFYVQTSTSENINVYDYLKRIYGKTIQHSFTNMVVKIFFIYTLCIFSCFRSLRNTHLRWYGTTVNINVDKSTL